MFTFLSLAALLFINPIYAVPVLPADGPKHKRNDAKLEAEKHDLDKKKETRLEIEAVVVGLELAQKILEQQMHKKTKLDILLAKLEHNVKVEKDELRKLDPDNKLLKASAGRPQIFSSLIALSIIAIAFLF